MGNGLYIMCVTGTREKLQMAAMTAAVKAAAGDPVSVFLSMNALPFFIRGHSGTPAVEGDVGVLLGEKNVPPFKQLFSQAAELGEAKLLPCSMAMDILGVKQEHLDSDLGNATGLTRFLSEAENGQLLTF